MRVAATTRAAVGALLACALLTACATPKPAVRSNLDPGANLSQYKTYNFVPQPGTNRQGLSTPITGYFKQAVSRELEARGYKVVETDPDLLINFSANSGEQVDIRSTTTSSMGYYGYRGGMYGAWPMYGGGTDVETVRYQVGTANVDVVDARQKKLLWEGLAEGKLSKDMMKNPQATIDSVVKDMFVEFPGKVAP